MKKQLVTLALAIAAAAPALAAPETFTLDGTHSFPRFSYSHFGYSVQMSRFDKTTGTIVLDKAGDVFMVTGSPGGNSIVGYVSKTLVAVLDWGKTAQEASSLPNIVARGQTVRVETSDAKAGPNAIGKAWAAMLGGFGFKVQEVSGEVSGLNLIVARGDKFEGGADPRREGVAIEITK